MSDSLWPPWTVAYWSLCSWDSPGETTRVGCHSLLQGIFLTQESHLHLLCLLNLARGFFTTSTTWNVLGPCPKAAPLFFGCSFLHLISSLIRNCSLELREGNEGWKLVPTKRNKGHRKISVSRSHICMDLLQWPACQPLQGLPWWQIAAWSYSHLFLEWPINSASLQQQYKDKTPLLLASWVFQLQSALWSQLTSPWALFWFLLLPKC